MTRTHARASLTICMLFLLALLAYLRMQSADRHLDPDELEHLNAAYFITQGETIYGTFFENHPPLMALLLQPVVRSSDLPEAIILRGRVLMLGVTAAILAAVGVLARPVGGLLASLLAAVLLLSQAFFFQKTLEVRPDVPALLFLIAALMALQRAVSRAGWRWPIAAGVLLCISGLFTPKVIYAAAGATLAACVSAGNPLRTGGWREATRILVLVTIGASVVAALAAAELARRGLLAGFFSDAVGASLRLVVDDPAAFRWFYLETTVRTNTVSWALALVGTVILWRGRHQLPAGYAVILCGSLAAGVAGLFLIQAPLRQYFLTFLPQVAIAGAAALAEILRRIPERWPAPAVAAVLAASLLAAVLPSLAALRVQAASMQPQLELMNRVLAMTRGGDRVLDCWTGLYLTRLPAYRYFYLNSDVQRLIPPDVLERELLRSLANPRVTLVIEDPYCARLSPNVLSFVRAEFSQDRELPFLWRRP